GLSPAPARAPAAAVGAGLGADPLRRRHPTRARQERRRPLPERPRDARGPARLGGPATGQAPEPLSDRARAATHPRTAGLRLGLRARPGRREPAAVAAPRPHDHHPTPRDRRAPARAAPAPWPRVL